MESILCLVKDDRLRTIDDFCSLFHAPCGGQAIHKDAVRLGMLHQFRVHLEGHEELLSGLLFLLRYAIAHPAIAIDDVHPGHCLLRCLELLDLAARLVLQLLDLLPNLGLDVACTRHVHVEAHERPGAHQVVGHVVLEVPEVCQGQPLPGALVLDYSLQVREHLHGVPVVVERVDDGDGGHLREGTDCVAAPDTGRDALAHAREHSPGVLNALFHSQRRVADGVKDGITTKLVHPNLQRHARPQ
mmetsp:Transcript_137218/g.382766  ORF Transcript_137218/g.382766 Transcript_137218/m.382766 type:complete len:244 (-) Transcript_137218:366-1097(-)